MWWFLLYSRGQCAPQLDLQFTAKPKEEEEEEEVVVVRLISTENLVLGNEGRGTWFWF